MPEKVTRQDRRNQIVALLQNTSAGLSHEEIAHKLGLAQTPYTRELLIGLQRDGFIDYIWQVNNSGQRVMVFFSTANLPTPAELDQAGISLEQL